MSKLLEDTEGNPSSKRIGGYVSGGLGLIMAIILYYFSLFKKVADPETALTVMNSLFLLAGSLLGIGVVEFFGKKK